MGFDVSIEQRLCPAVFSGRWSFWSSPRWCAHSFTVQSQNTSLIRRRSISAFDSIKIRCIILPLLSVSPVRWQDDSREESARLGNLNPVSSEKFLSGEHLNGSEYRRRFTDYVASLLSKDLQNNESTSIESGYRREELLVQCIFNGQSCSDYFSPFFHPNYGNCYTFNPDEHVPVVPRSGSSQFWSMDDGDRSFGYKLFLELYLFEDEYNPHLDDRAAFRIFIHRKNEVPILSQNSVFLAPTVFTKLLFSHRQIFLSRQCRTELTEEMKQTIHNHQGRYTQALCYKLCELRYIGRECHCTDPLLMIFFQFFRSNQSVPMSINRSCSSVNSCRQIRSNFSRIFIWHSSRLFVLI